VVQISKFSGMCIGSGVPLHDFILAGLMIVTLSCGLHLDGGILFTCIESALGMGVGPHGYGKRDGYIDSVAVSSRQKYLEELPHINIT
jgi:hypothetical protein